MFVTRIKYAETEKDIEKRTTTAAVAATTAAAVTAIAATATVH